MSEYESDRESPTEQAAMAQAEPARTPGFTPLQQRALQRKAKRRAADARAAADRAADTGAHAGAEPAEPRRSPLPDDVRGDMERSFGVSFANVRVHEGGSEAASVGARAFTQGNDIYFAPGAFQPDTAEGRQLLGHELAHVVQQRQGRAGGPQGAGGIDGDAALEVEADQLGARAARGEAVALAGGAPSSEASAAGPIQRKVGFEYEIASVGSAQVLPRGPDEQDAFRAEHDRVRDGKAVKAPFTTDMRVQPRDYLGTGDFVDFHTGAPGLGDQRFLALSKKDKIYQGDGFALEADEGNAVRGMHGAFSNIEFVTEAFEESRDGAAQLMRASQDIVRICRQIEAAGNAVRGGGRRYMHAIELGAGGVTGKVILPARDTSGELQVNIGMRLDRVATLMRAMAKSGAETPQEEARLRPGREVMGSGIDGANIASAFGQAPDQARAAIDRYARAPARTTENAFPATFGGPALEGFVALIVAYLQNATGNRIGYAKTIAPLMARTNFAALFALLPPAECAYLQAHPVALEAIVGDASGLTMNQDMFPNGIYNDPRTAAAGQQHALAGLRRDTWVGGMCTGVDFLTARDFNKGIGNPPNDPTYNDRKDDLESLGALGTRTERAGGVDTGIFEMRSLGGLSGKVSYPQLADRLTDLYLYIHQLNTTAQPNQLAYDAT